MIVRALPTERRIDASVLLPATSCQPWRGLLFLDTDVGAGPVKSGAAICTLMSTRPKGTMANSRQGWPDRSTANSVVLPVVLPVANPINRLIHQLNMD